MNLGHEIEAGAAFVRTLPGVEKSALIGSAMFLPEAEDVDYLVLVNNGQCGVDYTRDNLIPLQFEACGQHDTEGGTWDSVRRGPLNLVITSDEDFYEKFLRAMEVCKALRLTDKQQRVAVCRIVRDGWPASLALPPALEGLESIGPLG